MNRVYVDSVITHEIYKKLLELKTNWENTKLKLPQPTEGCGPVVTQLQKLGEEYQELYDIMTVLINSSAEFINAANNSFQETEQNLVDSIKVEKIGETK